MTIFKFIPKFFVLIALGSLSTGISAAVLKFATLAPDGSMWMQTMRAASQEIAARTENRVKLKFYPGGVMGDDQTILRKMRIGQLHGGTFTSAALAKYYSDSQVYNLPLKFRSFEEVDYVRERMDEQILSGFEKAGLIVFGLSETGFAYTMSQHAITRVADLKNHKVWVPSNDAMGLAAIRAFDVDPIPLGIGDVLTGLQTRLIDTIAAPPVGAIALQWHNQISYVTDLPVMYLFAILAMNEKGLKKLKPEDRRIVREVLETAASEVEAQTRRDNLAAFAALKTQGLKFVRPESADLELWQAKADKATQSLMGKGLVSAEIIKTLDQHLSTFRGNTGTQ